MEGGFSPSWPVPHHKTIRPALRFYRPALQAYPSRTAVSPSRTADASVLHCRFRRPAVRADGGFRAQKTTKSVKPLVAPPFEGFLFSTAPAARTAVLPRGRSATAPECG